MKQVGPARALLAAWWLLEFFGDSRRSGRGGSSLTTTIFTQSFLALVFAALLFPETPGTAFAAANLSLSSLLLGIGLLGDPARLVRADPGEMLLRTAPVRARTIALARAVHGGARLALVTTGMALPPAILGFWLHGHGAGAVLRYLVVATVVAGIVAGALAVVGQLLVLLLGTARGLLALGTCKAVLLGGGFVGFALALPELQGTVATLPFPPWLVAGWPPYLGALLVGDPLAHPAAAAALAGMLIALLGLAAALEWRERPALAPHRHRRGLLRALLQRLARGPAERGAAAFVATMLLRCPGYRARVLPLFGVPLAMTVLAFRGQAGEEARMLLGVTLQFPAIYLPFLILFLPRTEQPDVGWVFATAPVDAMRLGRSASLLALTTHVLLPAQVAAVLLATVAGLPLGTLLPMAVFAFGVGVVVTAIAVARLPAMPFTLEAADEEHGFEFGAVLVGAVLLTLIGAGHAAVAGQPLGLGLSAVAITAAIAVLRRRGAVA